MDVKYNLEAPRATLGLNLGYRNHLHPSLAPENRTMHKKNVDQNVHALPESSGEESGNEGVNIGNEPNADKCTDIPLSKQNPKRRNIHGPLMDDPDEFVFQRAKKARATFGKSGRTVKPRINNPSSKNELVTKKSPDTGSVSAQFKVPGGQEALVKLGETGKLTTVSEPVFNDPLAYGNLDNEGESKSLRPKFKEPLPATGMPFFIDPRSKSLPQDRDQTNGSENRSQHRRHPKLYYSPHKHSRDLTTINKSVDIEPAHKVPRLKVSMASTTSATSSNSSSLLSSPSSNEVDFSSSATTNILAPSSPDAQEPKCPYCNGTITPSVLSDFMSEHMPSSTGRLKIRQQRLFCHHHRLLDAKDKWISAGYPEIEWPSLHRRLETHKLHIVSIIDDKTPCFYRQRLRDLNNAQRARGGRQTVVQEFEEHGDGGELLGYYGTRGARIIGDFVMANFKRNLRGLQKRDQDLVISGGIGNFVQAVLVPEIIQRLIIEDFRSKYGERSPEVEATEARSIMENSSDLGRLLCEEEEDVVEARSDDETSGYGE